MGYQLIKVGHQVADIIEDCLMSHMLIREYYQENSIVGTGKTLEMAELLALREGFEIRQIIQEIPPGAEKLWAL